ncbi:hypothetical protein GCM10027214_13760 [Stenotrophomonas tumulicola]
MNLISSVPFFGSQLMRAVRDTLLPTFRQMGNGMAGWDRQVLRAYAPAVIAWLAAVAGWMLLERVPLQALQLEPALLLRWAVAVLLVATFGHGGWVSWRLWRTR